MMHSQEVTICYRINEMAHGAALSDPPGTHSLR